MSGPPARTSAKKVARLGASSDLASHVRSASSPRAGSRSTSATSACVPTSCSREVEPRDDAEVAAAAPQPPEQVGVLVGRRADQLAVRRHDLVPERVVAGQPELPTEPPDAPAERQPADAGVRHDPRRRREPERLRRRVERPEQRPALHLRRARARVDDDAPHPRQVDHQPAVGHRPSRRTVPAAPHAERQTELARDPDRGAHVVGAGAPHDVRRATVDGAVPDGARRVVLGGVGDEDLALEAGGQRSGRGHATTLAAVGRLCQGLCGLSDPSCTMKGMTLTFSGIVIDSTDPAAVADFWQQALGWSGRQSGERGEAIIHAQEGETVYGPPSIVFQPVPEARTVKNRVHLDFYSPDQDADVARLEALGATRVDVGQGPARSFVVLADIEGNEFCVLSEE